MRKEHKSSGKHQEQRAEYLLAPQTFDSGTFANRSYEKSVIYWK